MWEERALRVIRLLNEAGREAYFVGGCVRDFLRGTLPHDFDVTTSALPEKTAEIFRSAGFPVIGTGMKHGTVTVLCDGLPVEVTTYRIDGNYSDGRHPDGVRFTASLREDLARRDLTVNAMAWHPDGGLFDPFGGQDDLKRGVLRCVGDPENRFSEDALRILRVLRFSSVLGFAVEKNTDTALRELKDRLREISAERIREETEKLICGADAFRVLSEYPDVLGVFLPELLPCVGFDQRNFHHCFDLYTHLLRALSAVPSRPIPRLAALLHDIGKPACFSTDENGVGHFYGHAAASAETANTILRRLKWDNATREAVVTLIRHHDAPIRADEAAVRHTLNRLGEERYFDLLSLQRADTLALAPEFRDRIEIADRARQTAEKILSEKQCFSLRDLAVKGGDLMASGYRGSDIGAGLKLLLNAVLDGTVANEKTVLLAYLREEKP